MFPGQMQLQVNEHRFFVESTSECRLLSVGAGHLCGYSLIYRGSTCVDSPWVYACLPAVLSAGAALQLCSCCSAAAVCAHPPWPGLFLYPLQVFLLLLMFVSVPWMLLPKPLILKKRAEAKASATARVSESMSVLSKKAMRQGSWGWFLSWAGGRGRQRAKKLD